MRKLIKKILKENFVDDLHDMGYIDHDEKYYSEGLILEKFIRETGLEVLPDYIETVNGNLDLTAQVSSHESFNMGRGFTEPIKIKSLNKLKIVNGNFYLGENTSYTFPTQIEDLGELEIVRGNFSVRGATKLTSLSKLKAVTGELRLEGSNVRDLGELEVVLGNLDLRSVPLTVEDLKNSKLRRVDGRVLSNTTNIVDYFENSDIVKGGAYYYN